MEAYKGIHVLLDAWQGLLKTRENSCNLWQKDARLIIAGRVAADVNLPSLPPGVELRNRRISDEEGIDLFRRCSLVVLPYINAT